MAAVTVKYVPAMFNRVQAAVGFERLQLGREATMAEVRDYVALLIKTIVHGYEKAEAAKAAAAAVQPIVEDLTP